MLFWTRGDCLAAVAVLISLAAWGVSGMAKAEDCEIGTFGCEHRQHHNEYKSWQNQRGGDCCNGRDCRPVRASKDEGGRWSIWIPELKRWVEVPPSAVLEPDKLGDGRSHACTSDPLGQVPSGGGPWPAIYCFTPALTKG